MTTTLLVRDRPASNEALRRSIYQGTVFHLDGGEPAAGLAAAGQALLTEGLGDVCEDVRLAQSRLSPEEFFSRVGAMRRRAYLDPDLHARLAVLLDSLGFDLERVAVDPLRLRVSAHRGYENPAAAAVYYTHRDTWYGHPQSLIVGWIAIADVVEEETFVFLPEWFARAVPNDSEVFDYDEWTREGTDLRIGWQNARAGLEARYPRLTGALPPTSALGFSARSGDVLLFSGSHLHETRRQAVGRTRFSLDFRLVHLDDERAGVGAPNVDNRSRGSALRDYARPVSGTFRPAQRNT